MELSERGKRGLAEPLSYFPLFNKAMQDPFEAEKNPEGFLVMAVAENKTTYKSHILPKLKSLMSTVKDSDFDEVPVFYDDMKGNLKFRTSCGKYLQKYFLSEEVSSYKFPPENITVTAGLSSALDMVSFALGDSKDGCIIPSPYYPAFDNDLVLKSDLVISKAPLVFEPNGEVRLTQESLEAALQKSLSSGHPPKILLLTNPNNPTGTCFSLEELQMALHWARSKGIYIVSDEVYARSMNDLTKPVSKFISLASVALNESKDGKIGDDVFILYGFSKDFCLSGFRVGLIYTENESFNQASFPFSFFSSVSSLSQLFGTKLMEDEVWLEDFQITNAKMVALARSKVTKTLKSCQVKVIDAPGALFLSAYFGNIIRKTRKMSEDSELSWEDEREFLVQIADICKVVMTPGEACHFEEPGWFRICFAFSEINTLDVFDKRISSFVNSIK